MSSKIEVSRELLALYLSGDGGDWVEAGHELRALLAKSDDEGKVNNRQMGLMQFVEKYAAPVVECQPAMAWALLNGNGQVRDLTARWDVAKNWDGLVQALYDAPPELAELQATIAQLKDEVGAAKGEYDRSANKVAQLTDENERLKGGQGEPVAWIVTDMNGDSYFAYDKQTPSDKPLYTSQPASVSVDACDHCGKHTQGLDGETKWCTHCGGKL